MDLPPSGWYPDPYRTPSLLRWWDGSGWTQHTHPDVTTTGGAPAETAVQSAALDVTAVQGSAVQDAAVQDAVAATAVQRPVRPAGARPTAERLARTKPPGGPPTQPQPGLPASPAAVPAAYQGPATVPYQPMAVQPVPGNPYGYQQARRRRRRLAVGLTAGTVVAVAAIALTVTSLRGPRSTATADQSSAALPTAAASSATASPSASASSSPTATMTGVLTDSQSGLSYEQLPTPWQATASCPLTTSVFPWTDGEDAIAGQVNGDGGPLVWYGEACSGPLPQQYGYTGTADLQNAADSVASTFESSYYSALNGAVTQGQDTSLQVSGHAAWEVTYDVSYPDAAAQGATWTDEEAAVVVVDMGSAPPGVFFTSIPGTLGDGSIPALVSSLRVAGSAVNAGTTATATPTGTATPTDSAQADGGNNP